MANIDKALDRAFGAPTSDIDRALDASFEVAGNIDAALDTAFTTPGLSPDAPLIDLFSYQEQLPQLPSEPIVADPKEVYDIPKKTYDKTRGEDAIDRAAAGLARVMSAGAEFLAFQADRPYMPSPFGPRIEPQPKEAEELREAAKLFYNVANDPELESSHDDFFQTLLNLGAETVPFITATSVGTIAGGPLGGFGVASMVEGNVAYRNALANFELDGRITDVEWQKAKNIGIGVGIASGAIETVGGGAADQLFRRAAAKISNKAVRVGAQYSIGTIVEGLEEAAQEVTQITGETTYRDVNWRETVTRTLKAYGGGMMVGGPFRLARRGVGAVTATPEIKADAKVFGKEGLRGRQMEMERQAEEAAKLFEQDQLEALAVTPRQEVPFEVTEAEVGVTEQRTARERQIESLVDEGMSVKDAESVTMTAKEFAAEKKRLAAETSPAGQVSERLATIDKKNPTHGAKKRAGRIMSGLTKVRDTFASYLLKQDRMFQFARMMDGYDANGPFTTHIYRKGKDANVAARDGLFTGMTTLKENFDQIGVDFAAMSQNVRRDLAGGFPLSDTERLGIYMLAQNENGRRRVESVFAEEPVDNVQAVNEIVQSVEGDPQLMKAADVVRAYIDSRSPDFFAAAEKMGIKVKPEENYLMLVTLDPSEVDAPPIADAFTKQMGIPIRTKGEARTKARTRTRAKAKYDLMEILPSMIQSVEQLTNAGPAWMEIEKTMNDPELKRQLNRVTRGRGVELVRTWMQQSARGSIDHRNMPFEHTASVLRKNAVQYLLGYKVFSVVPKQAVSATNAIALRPSLAPGIMLRLARYGDLGVTGVLQRDFDRVSSLSKMMKNRDWERDMRRTFGQKNTRRFFRGKKLSPRAMRMTSYVDRATATSVWLSAFEKAMSDNNGNQDLAIQYADDVVTQTQPMGNIEELPEYFRGGLLAQAITTFQGQPSQNWNFLRHNILGELRAGKISKSQAMQRFIVGQVLPAMMLGIITRGRLPESVEEMAADIASYLVTPWTFFGRWVFNAVTQQWDPEESAVSGIGLRGFEEASRGIAAVAKGDARKAAERGIGTVGAFTGLVPQQVITTTGGVIDLAEGETDDFRRLIYSKYKIEKIIDAGAENE